MEKKIIEGCICISPECCLLCLVMPKLHPPLPKTTSNPPPALYADCIKKAVTVEYLDGLGRTKQIVNVKASPTGKDVVTHVEYDGFGRTGKRIFACSAIRNFQWGYCPKSFSQCHKP